MTLVIQTEGLTPGNWLVHGYESTRTKRNTGNPAREAAVPLRGTFLGPRSSESSPVQLARGHRGRKGASQLLLEPRRGANTDRRLCPQPLLADAHRGVQTQGRKRCFSRPAGQSPSHASCWQNQGESPLARASRKVRAREVPAPASQSRKQEGGFGATGQEVTVWHSAFGLEIRGFVSDRQPAFSTVLFETFPLNSY